jgi:hypothetical protein
LFITFLENEFLPVPKQYVLSPLIWIAKVDVVLLGLKTVGISYLLGEGLLSKKKFNYNIIIITYYVLISNFNLQISLLYQNLLLYLYLG